MSVCRHLRRGLTAVALATVAACGGGGGDGGGSGTSTAIQYSGNTSAAVITPSNAGRLTSNVIGGGSGVDAATSSVSGGRTQVGHGQVDIGRRLVRTVRATTTSRPRGASPLTSVLIDEANPCENGGSVRIFGDVSPTGTGTVNVSYVNCRIGADTLSGLATMRIDAFDLPNS